MCATDSRRSWRSVCGSPTISSNASTTMCRFCGKVIDGMENRADSLYAGWPERFYIVDGSNTIVYKGKTGPFGYHPEEVEAWLAGHLL